MFFHWGSRKNQKCVCWWVLMGCSGGLNPATWRTSSGRNPAGTFLWYLMQLNYFAWKFAFSYRLELAVVPHMLENLGCLWMGSMAEVNSS